MDSSGLGTQACHKERATAEFAMLPMAVQPKAALGHRCYVPPVGVDHVLLQSVPTSCFLVVVYSDRLRSAGLRVGAIWKRDGGRGVR